MSRIKDIFDLPTNYNNADIYDQCIVGVEMEIEDIKYQDCHALEDRYGVLTTEDGSLRNNGYEYLIPPHKVDNAIDIFQEFHTQKYVKYGFDAFSPRTSIHVHVNCLLMDDSQVRNLLFLYSIFEPIFFSFIGKDRLNNIHCVPLSYTHMSQYYKHSIMDIVASWHKYTAFNVLPLRKLGTVEFRHMGGHNDTRIFGTWLKMISVLWDAAYKADPITPLSLIDLRWLENIQNNLITKEVITLSKEPINFELKRNLIDVKLGLM